MNIEDFLKLQNFQILNDEGDIPLKPNKYYQIRCMKHRTYSTKRKGKRLRDMLKGNIRLSPCPKCVLKEIILLMKGGNFKPDIREALTQIKRGEFRVSKFLIICEKCGDKINVNLANLKRNPLKMECSKCTHRKFLEWGRIIGEASGFVVSKELNLKKRTYHEFTWEKCKHVTLFPSEKYKKIIDRGNLVYHCPKCQKENEHSEDEARKFYLERGCKLLKFKDPTGKIAYLNKAPNLIKKESCGHEFYHTLHTSQKEKKRKNILCKGCVAETLKEICDFLEIPFSYDDLYKRRLISPEEEAVFLYLQNKCKSVIRESFRWSRPRWLINPFFDTNISFLELDMLFVLKNGYAIAIEYNDKSHFGNLYHIGGESRRAVPTDEYTNYKINTCKNNGVDLEIILYTEFRENPKLALERIINKIINLSKLEPRVIKKEFFDDIKRYER